MQPEHASLAPPSTAGSLSVRIAAWALILAPALATAYLGSVGSLFLDDLALWGLAQRHPFPGPDLLSTSWFGHLMPGGMLAIWFESRVFGLEKWAYGLTQGLGLLWVMYLLWRLSQLFLGTGVRALVPLGFAASSFSLIGAAAWYANAIWVIPLMVVTLLAVLTMLRARPESTSRATYLILGLLTAGLCFSEKAALIPVTLFVVDIARREDGLVRALRLTWLAWRPLWISSSLLLLGYVVVLRQIQQTWSGGAPFEPRPAEIASTITAIWTDGFPAGQLGGPVVWVNALLAAPPDWFLAYSRVLLLVILIAALTMSRGSRRMAIWTVAALAGMAAVLASTRFIALQGLVVMQVRYGADVVPLLAITIMFTLRASTRPDRFGWLRSRRFAPVATVGLAAVTAITWTASLSSAARGFKAETGTPVSQTISAVRAYLEAMPADQRVLDTPLRDTPFGAVQDNTGTPLLLSDFYGPLVDDDRFVDSSDEPLLYDGAGRFSQVAVAGQVAELGGPLCLSPDSPVQTVALPAGLFPGLHVAQAAVDEPSDATVEVRADTAVGGAFQWLSTRSTTWLEGGGGTITLRLVGDDPVCLTGLEVGPPARASTTTAPGAPAS